MTVWYSLLLLTMTHLLLSWYSYELAAEKNHPPIRYALLAWCPLLNVLSLIHLLRLPTPPLNVDHTLDELATPMRQRLTSSSTKTHNLWV